MHRLLIFITALLATGCASMGCNGTYFGEMYGYKGGYCHVAGTPMKAPDMKPDLPGPTTALSTLRSNARAAWMSRYSYRPRHSYGHYYH